MMVASHKPLGRKESLIQIVARRLSSKQRPGSAARLGEEEVPEALSETSAEIGGVGGGGGEGSERKQSLVDMLAARFSRTPRQLRVGGSQIEGETSDESVEGTPETERRESLVKKISRRFSRTPKLQLKLGDEDLEFIMLHTGLEKEAVELHFKQFQRSHPGGVMDPAGLRAMLQESLPGADTAGLANHIWRIYDTNLDGEVDFREFMLALCVMRTGSAEENLRQIFRAFDINSDGKVERSELGSVAEELSKLGSGEVKDELVQRAFNEMDADMDGGITQEEFVSACLQQRVAATSLALKVIDIFVAG